MSERLPPPPAAAELPELRPDDVEDVSSLSGRVYRAGGAHGSAWHRLRYYGPTSARFDQQPEPPGVHPEHGVMYLAFHRPNRRQDSEPPLKSSVLEAFQSTRVIELSRDSPWFVLFRPTRALRLLNLADSSWIARAGGNAAITSGPRDRSRQWARAIHARFHQEIDGLLYQSSVLPSAFVGAVWERAGSAIPHRPLLHRPLTEPDFRADLEAYARELRYGLLP